jgi:hypothetical protein
VLRRATALRAVVVECERNPPEVVVGLFEQVRALVADAPGFRGPPAEPPPVSLALHAPAPGRDLRGAADLADRDVDPVRGLEVHPPVDHRRVQRTLFRMLLDPGFADQVRADPPVPEPAATWLRSLDPALLAADPDQGRVRQLLGNVATELLHTVRAAPPFLDGFPSSPELHRALADDAPLVLALAAYADRVLPEGPWRAVLRLDAAMAEVRRARTEAPFPPSLWERAGVRVAAGRRPPPPAAGEGGGEPAAGGGGGEPARGVAGRGEPAGEPALGGEREPARPGTRGGEPARGARGGEPAPEGEGEPASRGTGGGEPARGSTPARGMMAGGGPAPGAARALSPLARILELPEGTVAAAGALREGAEMPPIGPGVEQVVVVRGPAGVQVEVVGDAVAELLRAGPLTEAVLDGFAARHEATRDEVDGLVADLVGDGILA